MLTGNINITRPLNAVAAGTSVQAGSGVLMDGFAGVLFIAAVGALTATQVTGLKAQQSSDDGTADDYSDIEGSAVGPFGDSDGNKLLVLDVYQPKKRYVKPVVTRGTANAVIDGVIAIRYGADVVPQDLVSASIVAAKALVSPNEGTA